MFQFYTPAMEDIGYRFKVVVSPGNDKYPSSEDRGHGDSVCLSAVTKSVIRAGPTELMYEHRAGVHSPPPLDSKLATLLYQLIL